MATPGLGTFSTRSFYGSRARAQRDRPRVPLIEPNFGDSDKESDYDEDEANIPDEESDYSSPSEDESGEDDADDKYLLSEKELKKKGRGSFDFVVEANSGVTVIRWFDNGLVQLLSNYVGNDLAAQARRWSRKEGRFINIDRPAMVVQYNSNMGGVDLCDMLMSMYRIRHRSTKYYMHMVFYCIGVAVVNGWLLYRRHLTQKNVPRKNHMSLLMFQTEIAVGLCKAGKSSASAARARGRPSSTSPVPAATPSRKRKAASTPNPTRDVQFDQCGHFPVFQEKQQRCRHCKTGYSHLKCCKCEVHLCLVKCRNCFNAFHGVN